MEIYTTRHPEMGKKLYTIPMLPNKILPRFGKVKHSDIRIEKIIIRERHLTAA